MKCLLTILLFAGFFAQAQMEVPNKSGGFFSLNIGAAVDSKLTKFNYPFSLSYGGSILEDRDVGMFEVGIVFYRDLDEFSVPVHLMFKYAYDFMGSDSVWGLGVDTALYLGGANTEYAIDAKGNVVKESKYSFYLRDNQEGAEIKQGIALYFGHDLGLFVRKRISVSILQPFSVLLRIGMNNALVSKPRFLPKKSDEKEEEIKVVHEFLNPNFYLSTGFQWYF